MKNKVKFKRGFTFLLSLVLCLSLFGCQSKKGSEEFAAYAKEMPAILTKHNSFDINFLFDKPEDYGIQKESYTLNYISLEDYKKYDEELRAKFEELKDFDYEKLNKDQQITYDLLENASEELDVDVEDYYYLATNYLDTNTGVQAQLPMSLWNYELKNKKSVDSLLAILDQAPDMFKKYTDLEKTRQEKGFGMAETKMKHVIEAIHTINTTDQSYILKAIEKQLDEVDFLSTKEKASYKQKIKEAFEGPYLKAWQQAEKDLKDIKILKKGEGELSSYKNGKVYYEQIVTEAAGVKTMEEYTKFLEGQQSKISLRIIPLFKKYPELKEYITDTEKLMKAMQDIHYTDLKNSNDIIKELEKKIAEGKEFPKIEKLQYEMREFPKSMKDTTMLAAAYFVSAYDGGPSHKERMLLNGTFKQSDFTVIAHESFPGHMYQHNYFKTIDHDILRDLLGSSAYSEGWATYIQDKACDLSLEPGLCHFTDINNQLTYTYILDLDKKIHYDGMSRQEAYDFLKANFQISDEEQLKELYEQLLENPGVFANYYASLYRILELKSSAQEAWGDDYSEYRFHKEMLDLGPIPMDLLRKHMDLSAK